MTIGGRSSRALVQCVLLLLVVVLGAACSVLAAESPPCSDPATCGAVDNCCTKVSGTTYCCPGSGNALNFATLQCYSYANCGQ